ncbi:E3 ubiquitin-protein ligase TRIM45-like [Saccostrea echinata]|uniref:E3 ubiquitin-protein ligase TRIM45-like n=1 Tax=Saccostrea echinata TaxID=191078 RepID=UPI002A8348F6|nr:E3 ubiquitin-protein ligase TRIM45-like [Saccostrea echinata]
MDPRTSGQDVLRCDHCEDNLAQMFCSLCPVNLCKLCVGEHVTDISKKHDVLPLNLRKSMIVYPLCKIHSREHCETHCEDCNIPVCSRCVNSDKHKRHFFTSLQDLLNVKKKSIEKEKKRLQETVISTFEEMASDFKSQLVGVDEQYEKLTSDVTKDGEERHREIDIIIQKTKDEIQEMRSKHKNTLNKHLNEIEKLIFDVKESLSEIEDILQSNEVLKSLSYEIRSDKFIKLPPKVNVKPPVFTPSKTQGQFLNLFGSLSHLSMTTEKHVFTMHSSEAVSSPKVKPLLEVPKLIASIKTEYSELYNVTCLSDEELFTSGNDNVMNIYDPQGKLLKPIQTKSGKNPFGIAVTRSRDLVYTDPDAKTINIVKKKNIQEVIRLQGWRPYNVCSTSCGDLLVFMSCEDKQKSKLVRYSNFSKKQSIKYDDQLKPLYSYGELKYICENKNLDICVSDYGAKAVVVVNQEGKFRFRYTGHPSTKTEIFNPMGITTDSQAHILIADYMNNRIHILDQDSQFLCYIVNCDLYFPWGLSVDTRDNLFVAEFGGKLKKIQYML